METCLALDLELLRLPSHQEELLQEQPWEQQQEEQQQEAPAGEQQEMDCLAHQRELDKELPLQGCRVEACSLDLL